MKKPIAPILRIINETLQVGICKKCGSSLIRKWLLFFWLPKFCINKQCEQP